MDYTTSIDNVVHSGTGHRMHSDSIAIPTAWSGNDANMVVWSLMEVLRLAGVSGKAFNPDDPASYTRFRDALVTTFAGLDSPAFRGSPQAPVPPLFDNTTRLATTSWYWNQIATGVNSAGKINGVNSPNLLFNGSGEFGSAGWGSSVFSSTQGGFGEGSIFLNNSAIASGASMGDVSSPIPMGAATPIALGCLITTAGLTAGRVYVNVEAFNSSGVSLGAFMGTAPVTTSRGWAYYSATGTTPAGTASVTVRRWADNSPRASAFGIGFGNIKLEQGSTPSLYSQEANFVALGTGPNPAPLNAAPATKSQHALTLGQATGRLLTVQSFQTVGTSTYTPTPGTTAVLVRVQGGGGSGGGCAATGSGQVSVGSGGAAGAYAESYITNGFSGVPVTVGAGGIGASGQASNPGGSSSFGALVSAPGGPGGSSAGPTAPPWITGISPSANGSGGSIVNSAGAPGQVSVAQSAAIGYGGPGGVSVFGAGGGAGSLGSNGQSAPSRGAGGGGTMQIQSSGALAGGNGAPGIVIVYEFGSR
ncbi:hypothetical protein [Burkholderia cenocepacia]|uniref:glycine-rich domain-containing protein n=1 Tax=Burkholderia cenocepacia TaxID=95486 RepID=UPI0020115375|nr:hypothetical protein [Burkholderia cenocepacia]